MIDWKIMKKIDKLIMSKYGIFKLITVYLIIVLLSNLLVGISYDILPEPDFFYRVGFSIPLLFELILSFGIHKKINIIPSKIILITTLLYTIVILGLGIYEFLFTTPMFVDDVFLRATGMQYIYLIILIIEMLIFRIQGIIKNRYVVYSVVILICFSAILYYFFKVPFNLLPHALLLFIILTTYFNFVGIYMLCSFLREYLSESKK
jgi:hypothetical protein